jgi:hypothetical protein
VSGCVIGAVLPERQPQLSGEAGQPSDFACTEENNIVSVDSEWTTIHQLQQSNDRIKK